jgi:hypothetical protein
VLPHPGLTSRAVVNFSTETAGNRGAWMLRRDEGDRTEFITLSMWESEDAIRAFVGDDIEAAVLYPEGRALPDRRLLGDPPPGGG